MKKTKLLAGIVAVSLLISLASCSNSSGGSSDDEALAGIKIDGVLYEKTGEVYATGKDGASISGKTNTDKAKTLGELFNNYLPEERNLIVEGCINIDGEDYIIKRRIGKSFYT